MSDKNRVLFNNTETSINPRFSNTRRFFSPDFDQYIDGNDDFRKELIPLIIGNITELQESFRRDSPEALFAVCHKVTFTVTLLSDAELSETIKELKELIRNSGKVGAIFHEKLLLFNAICSAIVENLKAEFSN